MGGYRIAFLSAAILCAAGIAILARADDATPPPIREFDLPTIEWLGWQMNDQDQEAWKATDVLTARFSADERRDAKLHGWIVEKLPDHDVVRFVRDGASGPELWYDVNFVNGQPQGLSAPATTVLTADQLAQYNARELALANVKVRCSDRYNTVALKDPQRPGWLVWAMAATTDPDVIVIGGHYRFTISADGKTVIQADRLSRGCLRVSKKGDPSKGTLAAFYVDQLVSLTPIETQVFANLSYGLELYVDTPDGRYWKIDKGRITNIDLDSSGIDGTAARGEAGADEKCELLLTDSDRKVRLGPEVHVITSTEHGDRYEVPPGQAASGIGCARNDIVPAPNDYKVILAGLALFISDKGAGHPRRLGVLESRNGQFVYRIVEGDPLTPDLQARVGARLDGFQKAANSSH